MAETDRGLAALVRSEDWWAVWVGFVLIGLAVVGAVVGGADPAAEGARGSLGDWIRSTPGGALPETWSGNPADAFTADTAASGGVLLLALAVLTTVTTRALGRPVRAYMCGFVIVFLLALVANTIAQQEVIKSWGLGYALWALVVGLVVANTIGTPPWLLAGARSELFIKIGLVLLGAEILFSRLLELGGPGLVVAWFVTPIVILTMWQFGTRILRIESRALVIVIACATSVCGVSAAIAAAAASRAKKDELTLAVSMTMIFTVAMMVCMPALATAMGLDQFVGGAWIGGTVDSTGAVVAAGAIMGEQARDIAAVVKMIQNTLIGLVAFLIALYWVLVVERGEGSERPSAKEIWRRFPKFVLGFLAASLLFSFVLLPWLGSEPVAAVTGLTKALRGWWFALAFCAIGLESDFRKLASQFGGGKPIWLYITGQTFNVLLTLLAAWLAFGGVLFAAQG